MSVFFSPVPANSVLLPTSLQKHVKLLKQGNACERLCLLTPPLCLSVSETPRRQLEIALFSLHKAGAVCQRRQSQTSSWASAEDLGWRRRHLWWKWRDETGSQVQSGWRLKQLAYVITDRRRWKGGRRNWGQKGRKTNRGGMAGILRGNGKKKKKSPTQIWSVLNSACLMWNPFLCSWSLALLG